MSTVLLVSTPSFEWAEPQTAYLGAYRGGRKQNKDHTNCMDCHDRIELKELFINADGIHFCLGCAEFTPPQPTQGER